MLRWQEQQQEEESEKVVEERQVKAQRGKSVALIVVSLWNRGGGMNKENALTRKKLKQIDSVEDFDRMLNNLMASEEDKKIIEMHYKQGKSLGYIADVLGMSESSVKNKHRKLLIKIGNIM